MDILNKKFKRKTIEKVPKKIQQMTNIRVNDREILYLPNIPLIHNRIYRNTQLHSLDTKRKSSD